MSKHDAMVAGIEGLTDGERLVLAAAMDDAEGNGYDFGFGDETVKGAVRRGMTKHAAAGTLASLQEKGLVEIHEPINGFRQVTLHGAAREAIEAPPALDGDERAEEPPVERVLTPPTGHDAPAPQAQTRVRVNRVLDSIAAVISGEAKAPCLPTVGIRQLVVRYEDLTAPAEPVAAGKRRYAAIKADPARYAEMLEKARLRAQAHHERRRAARAKTQAAIRSDAADRRAARQQG